jgi:DNA-binding NarL/FixJ family response regulator
MSKPRILIADDHQIFAEGLRSLLEPEFDVVGLVADGRELVAIATKHRPDVIVADLTMPSLNGIEAAVQLRKVGVNAKVVFLTMHRDVVYARRAMEAGAAGFVLKHSAASELVTAVRDALRGQTYVTPMIAGAQRMNIRSSFDAITLTTNSSREQGLHIAERFHQAVPVGLVQRGTSGGSSSGSPQEPQKASFTKGSLASR